MPRVRPFPGLRYRHADKIGELVCPPYDVISEEQQQALHDLHPHNAIRLELARGEEGHPDSRYDSAARTFSEWVEGDVLRADEPSFYVYRQDFVGPHGDRRRVAGVIGALELEPFGERSGVLPHERTMEGPKKDRLALLRAMPVNVSPIYAIYRGGGELGPYLDSLEHRPHAARFVDDHEVLHRLWQIQAPAEVEMLAAALGPGPLVIADGHHRYETALAFHEEMRTDGSSAVMCLCVDADAEELVVLPYNRMIRSRAPVEEIDAALRAIGGRPLERAEAPDALDGAGGDHAFVFLLPQAAYLVETSDEEVIEVVGERAEAWRALDVVALHEVVLRAIFPGGPSEMAFTKDPAEVDHAVLQGVWDVGVLLRPLAPPQIVDVARSGERMPQKASYFWPKAVTGLVFRSLR